MNMNLRIENYTAQKAMTRPDSESIIKDKRYKLGAWLHSEYRNKKVAAHQGHRTPSFKGLQSDI
jgi:hypothetical protein